MEQAAAAQEEGETIRFRHAKHFNASFWLIILLASIWFACFFPFNNIASGYLQDTYYGRDCISEGFNATCRINATSRANVVMSIPLGLSAVLMPLVVWVVDQIGLRPFCCVLASLGLTAAYILLRFPVFTVPTDSPIPAMILLGASYAVFAAAIWPSMYLEVNEEHRASAFAFASAAKNVALAITPLAIGYTRNRSVDYDNVESLMLAGACTTLLLCLMLGCINSNRRGSRGHLNAPTYATIQSPGSIAVRLPPNQFLWGETSVLIFGCACALRCVRRSRIRPCLGARADDRGRAAGVQSEKQCNA